jgi:hypothetical protein
VTTETVRVVVIVVRAVEHESSEVMSLGGALGTALDGALGTSMREDGAA